MNNDTLGVLFFAVALFGMGAMARYYVLGVIERDRLLSRWALVGVLVFGAVVVWGLVGSFRDAADP